MSRLLLFFSSSFKPVHLQFCGFVESAYFFAGRMSDAYEIGIFAAHSESSKVFFFCSSNIISSFKLFICVPLHTVLAVYCEMLTIPMVCALPRHNANDTIYIVSIIEVTCVVCDGFRSETT